MQDDTYVDGVTTQLHSPDSQIQQDSTIHDKNQFIFDLHKQDDTDLGRYEYKECLFILPMHIELCILMLNTTFKIDIYFYVNESLNRYIKINFVLSSK